ncbi:barstar family protein [Streptomyces sp.]|uniref:barstar family protein n=1 Tax=Streptomyces sp. TaxID=1931 RepID=UPI0025FCA1BF|nr:barstar family protein [Streptomyces sp.]
MPWVVIVTEGTAGIRRRLAGLTARGGLVHHFDARGLMTAQAVLCTSAEVLRFPGYVGRNWDALVD